jgi:hypothetical protein
MKLETIIAAASVCDDPTAHQLVAIVYRAIARRYEARGNHGEAARLTALTEEQEALRAEARFRQPSPYKLTSTAQREARRLAAYKGHETRSENEHSVTVNIPPEHLALWERVKASIRGTPHQRWQRFTEYVEEHPGEAMRAVVDQVDECVPSSRAA